MKLSENEITIYKKWLLNKKNKDIAQEMGVSESYISQTIDKFESKLTSIKDSVAVLEQIGAIDPITPIKIAGKNRRSIKRASDKQKKQSLNIMSYDYKVDNTKSIRDMWSIIQGDTAYNTPVGSISVREFWTPPTHSISNVIMEKNFKEDNTL